MLNQVATMFDNKEEMMKKLKKKVYEKNMGEFRQRNGHYFQEMTAYMDGKTDKEEAAREIAEVLTEAVKEQFTVKGKIKPRTQADLNFFMVYYVFPALLLTEHENATLLADTICSVWSGKFKDSKIGYTDYDKLYGAFNEKIFGIF